MSDNKRVFVDTNILIYRSFGTDEQKEILQNLLLQHAGKVHISTQVLNEFINATIKKQLFETELQMDAVLDYFINNFKISEVATSTILKANHIRRRYRLSYYDSVIVSAAVEQNCKVLYSEDMQHGLVLENTLTVINPFK
jgi:predicted nucleic acid-binding protein